MYGVCFFSKTKTASSYVKSTSFRFSDLWQYISPTTAVLSLVSDDVLQRAERMFESLWRCDADIQHLWRVFAAGGPEYGTVCIYLGHGAVWTIFQLRRL